MQTGKSAAAAALDPMIARAELACKRYREEVGRRGLSTPEKEKRLRRLTVMEATLARLRAQRERGGAIQP